MTPWYNTLHNITLTALKKQNVDVVKESYRDSGICISCIKKGGFPRICQCCNEYKEFPKEFKYQLTKYAKYPEDETELEYICSNCVDTNPKRVLKLASDYDEFSEIK